MASGGSKTQMAEFRAFHAHTGTNGSATEPHLEGGFDTGFDEGVLVANIGKRVAPLLLALLLPLVLALTWLAVRSPQYEATAKLVVFPVADDDDVRGLPVIRRYGEPTRTIQTAAALIGTRDIAERAAQQLGGSWTQSDVSENITIVPVGQTDVLGVKARDSSPIAAEQLANAYVDAVLAVRGENLASVVDAELAQLSARVEESPPALAADIEQRMSALRLLRTDRSLSLAERSTPAVLEGQRTLPLTIVAALFAGLALAIATYVVLGWMSPKTVGSVRSAAELLSCSVLGVVPGRSAIPLGFRRRSPSRDASFRVLVQRLRQQLDLQENALVIASPGSSGDARYVAGGLGIAMAATSQSAVLAVNAGGDGKWSSEVGSSLRSQDKSRRYCGGKALPGHSGLWMLDVDVPLSLRSGQMPSVTASVLDRNPPDDVALLIVPPALEDDELTLTSADDEVVILVVRTHYTTVRSLLLANDMASLTGVRVLGAIVVDQTRKANHILT